MMRRAAGIGSAMLVAGVLAGSATAQALGFEPNRGQTDASVLFVERGPGHTLFLTRSEAVFRTTAQIVRMSFAGASAEVGVAAERRQTGTSNYFKGAPDERLVNVPRFGAVRYQGVYPGIDALFHGDPERLELDFELAAGVSADAIRLSFEGQERLEISAGGDLLVGGLQFSAPRAFQVAAGLERPVAASFVLHADGTVGFEIGAHDPSLPLVIDPVLLYSSFLGGADIDAARGVVVAGGYTYVAGWTASVDFPIQGSLKSPPTGDFDAYVAMLDDAGRGLMFATYVGGSSSDFGTDVAVDLAGNVYLTGSTLSSDFPTLDAVQPDYAGGRDAFVVKLNPNGTRILYATFLGGAGFDLANAIAVDAFQRAHVCGTTASADFPVHLALQPAFGGGSIFGDAFLTGFEADGGSLLFSTFAGGTGDDQGRDVALDPAGEIALVGTTASDDFPLANAFQDARAGGLDAFVMKLGVKAGEIHYATYLGGGLRDFASGVAFNLLGSVCVVGDTSSPDFPLSIPFQAELGGTCDAFVTILKEPGVPAFSSFLGGAKIDIALRVAVDDHGDPVIVGETFSNDFPMRFAAQGRFAGGGSDGFVTRLTGGATRIAYSTYLGGSGFELAADVGLDSLGTATVVGDGTESEDFPQLRAFQDGFAGGSTDAFVTRMCIRPRECVRPFNARRAAAPSTAAPGSAEPAVEAMLELLRAGRSPLDCP